MAGPLKIVLRPTVLYRRHAQERDDRTAPKDVRIEKGQFSYEEILYRLSRFRAASRRNWRIPLPNFEINATPSTAAQSIDTMADGNRAKGGGSILCGRLPSSTPS